MSLLIQVGNAIIFRFVNIKEELRSQIFQHAIFQHLIMTKKKHVNEVLNEVLAHDKYK